MQNNFFGNQWPNNQVNKPISQETKRKELQNLKFQKGNYNEVKPQIQNHLKNWNKYEQNSKQIEQLYEDLERDDSFIQWIFPNFFSSMFNSFSYRLTQEERNLILNDEQAQQNYIRNYHMFLRFIGIKVDGDGQLILENENQLKKSFCYNTRTLTRIQRVLASLSVLGRRREALEFLEFMKQYEKMNSRFSYKQFESYQMTKEEFEQQKVKQVGFQNKTIQQVGQSQESSDLKQTQSQTFKPFKLNTTNDGKKATKNGQKNGKLQNQQQQYQQNNLQCQDQKKDIKEQAVLSHQNQQNKEQKVSIQYEFTNNKKKYGKAQRSIQIQSSNGDSDLSESKFQDFQQVCHQTVENSCKIEIEKINEQEIDDQKQNDQSNIAHNPINQSNNLIQKQGENISQSLEKNEICQDIYEDEKKQQKQSKGQFEYQDFQQEDEKNEIKKQSQTQIIGSNKQNISQQKRYELFETVKNYYVQRDLLKEDWVTAKLLTLE